MSTADAARRAVLSAARAILRPLVRQLISHGVTYPVFSRLAKQVYIEVGTVYFTLPFKKQTDSRVALVTGIARKEIGQIRRGTAVPRPELTALDSARAARVVHRWLTAAPYVDAAGIARLLPYETSDGPSFVALVGEIGGDIPPRAVLDELLRVGAARLTPRGAVALTERAAAPAEGIEERLAGLGTDAAELIEAIVHNIEQPGDEAVLQHTVRCDRLGADALPEVRARLRALEVEFARQAHELLNAYDRERNPAAPGGERSHAVVGVYYLDGSEPPDPD
jgi:Family of unknown function (DUF6502)